MGSKELSRLLGHTSLNHAAHADGCCTVLKSVNVSVALDRRGSTIPTGESNLRSLEEEQHVGILLLVYVCEGHDAKDKLC